MRKRNDGPLRYASYPRCSSDDQAHRDFSTTEVQHELNAKYVQGKGGILVQRNYSDEGYSGTSLKRPGWRQLLVDCQAGMVDVVVVTYMSRLGRGDAFIIAQYELDKCGARVEMVKESFTDDLSGYLNKTVTVMMDGMYPKMVSQWTRTKMQQMIEKGYCVGHLPTLGYRREFVESAGSILSADKAPPQRPIINHEEAEIVRFAFDLFLQTKKIATVRDHLQSVTDRPWTTTKTKAMLTHPAYVGEMVFGQWRNPNGYPPIIDRQTFESVQAIIGYGGESRKPKQTEYTYYLRGTIYCPHCGGKYTPWSTKQGSVRYYSCLSDMKRLTNCPVKRINSDALHMSILHAIRRAANHQTVMRKLISDSCTWSTPDDQLMAKRGQLAKKKQFVAVQITNITRAISEGRALGPLLSTLEKLEAAQETICRELRKVDEEVTASKVQRPVAKDVQAAWGEITNLWSDLTEDERSEVLGGLVRRIDAKQKDRVTLQLSPVAEVHGPKFEINSQLGAGTGLEPVTFGL